MDAHDPLAWYMSIPVVSRVYLTAALAVTSACFMDWVSPLTLYFNYDLVFRKGQYWRLLSSFLFFGNFSLDFLFHMYFVTRYCRMLEEGRFRGKTADFIFMILFGIVAMIFTAIVCENFSKIKFLGHSLSFMMVYVWGRGRENANVRLSLLGLYTFNAPYLPWVLLMFSLFLGNPIETDFLGIIIGHIYYFFDYIYPQVAEVRGWRYKKIMVAPYILHYICGTDYVPALGNTRVINAPVAVAIGALGGNENVPVEGLDNGHLHND